MTEIKIKYTQHGQPRCVSFQTTAPAEDVLEDIGRVTMAGSLYLVNHDGGETFAIAGRFIETVEVKR